jgi:hypothetical protein
MDDGVLFMGNYFSCKIVGVGIIHIKMYDSIVRKLTYVRHVPKHRKNLISLGVIYSIGYKCITQGGVLKVSKGVLVVIKENRIENLYHLEGRTEINQTVVASEGASDSTRLWNQCLGHMKEKGIYLLVDHKSLPSLKFLNLNFWKNFFCYEQCRKNFKIGRNIRKGFLDYIYSDVYGPFPTVSFG